MTPRKSSGAESLQRCPKDKINNMEKLDGKGFFIFSLVTKVYSLLRLHLDLSSLIFSSWACEHVSGLKINIVGDTNLSCADLAAAGEDEPRDIAFFQICP